MIVPFPMSVHDDHHNDRSQQRRVLGVALDADDLYDLADALDERLDDQLRRGFVAPALIRFTLKLHELCRAELPPCLCYSDGLTPEVHEHVRRLVPLQVVREFDRFKPVE